MENCGPDPVPEGGPATLDGGGGPDSVPQPGPAAPDGRGGAAGVEWGK